MHKLTADPILPGHRHAVAVNATFIRAIDGAVIERATMDYPSASRRFNDGELQRGEARALRPLGSDFLPTGSCGSSRMR